MADEIEQHLADNYDAIVADGLRNVSYEDIAKHAESLDDHNLAAWARKRAGAKTDVTPSKATPKPKSKRR